MFIDSGTDREFTSVDSMTPNLGEKEAIQVIDGLLKVTLKEASPRGFEFILAHHPVRLGHAEIPQGWFEGLVECTTGECRHVAFGGDLDHILGPGAILVQVTVAPASGLRLRPEWSVPRTRLLLLVASFHVVEVLFQHFIRGGMCASVV